MPDATDIAEFLQRAAGGDQSAFAELMARFDAPLRRGIGLRLDRRLGARIDVSDVVQETALEVGRRLAEYVRDPAMPFDLWLRWIAREKLLQLHRQHLAADKRTVRREVPALPVDSSAAVVRGLLGREPSPSRAAAAGELAELLRQALGQLDDDVRDLILWRHFEQLTNPEIAQLLGITPAAAGKRYIRAIERLQDLLRDLGVSGA